MTAYFRAQALALRSFVRGPFRTQLRHAAIAFAALLVLSYGAGRLFPKIAASAVEFYMSLLESGGAVSDGQISMPGIFANNLRAGALCVLYGIIPYIQLPALPLGVNSIMMGFLGAYYVNNGKSLLAYASGIVPHGILELPALILSIAGGLYLCRAVTERLRSGQAGLVKTAFGELARVFLLWILPLFLAAAAVEVYITPGVFALFAG